MANANTREDKSAGQAARETGRRRSNETQQFAEAAADVGEGAVRTGTELLRRNSEMMQQFWESARKNGFATQRSISKSGLQGGSGELR